MDRQHRGGRAIAALAVVFVLAGCTGGPGGSPSPTLAPPPMATESPTPPPSTTPTPTPTGLPTATAALDDLGSVWRAVQNPPLHAGDPGIVVTATEQGWIALASAPDAATATAWTSIDGLEWQQGPALPMPAGLDAGTITTMTSAGTDLYGLGSSWLTEGLGAIVWRSKAGGAWEVIGAAEAFELGPCPAGCASVSSIAASGSAVVVAGYRVVPDGDRFEVETDLWYTLDGLVWVRLAAPIPTGSSDRAAAEITVAAGGPGFVAAGTLCKEDGRTCRAVTWTSIDGGTWAPPADLPDGSGVRAQQIAIGPSGAVVLGQRCTTEGGCALVAWGSDDGLAWQLADLAGTYVEGSTELAACGETLLLVTTTDAGDAAAWTSTDGRVWASEAVEAGLDPARPLAQILQLAGRAGSAMAVGLGPEENAGLWISP